MSGEANYYPDNCVRCGDSLARVNGIRPDEWHRGHCPACFSYLAAPAKIDYRGAENLITVSTQKPANGEHGAKVEIGQIVKSLE